MTPQTLAADIDEDTLIRQDKELSELEFRYGRLAVRDEIDRRALQVGTPQDSDSGSPISPFAPQQQELPLSPLASYYPSGNQPPPAYRAPSPAFDPGYSFPPRDSTTQLISSTTHLLPHNEPLPPPPASLAPAVGPNGLPPAILQSGRRASLPIISTPFAPRAAAQTLSRIQSLPEPDPDAPSTPQIAQVAQVPHVDLTEPTKDTKPKTTSSGTTSSSDAATGTTGDDLDPDALYDEEGGLAIREVGWRQRLRLKIQAGIPLTRLELAQRFLGLDVVTWTEVFKIFVTGMVAGWGVAAMREFKTA
jgi:hypothetical protein